MGSRPAQPPGVPHDAIIFGPQANCTLDICPLEYSVYGYCPSLAANVTFIALFAAAALIHAWLSFKWHTWFFTGCTLIGCLSAMIGYAGRVMMYYNPFNFVAFMIQITCVTTTPVYFCAAIYVTLATTIEHLSPTLSRFPPKLLYIIFIPCDLCSLIIQAAGGGLTTQSKGQSRIGIDLALAGLSFQVFTIVTWCGLFADYLYRYTRSGQLAAHAMSARLKIFFLFLFSAILLITTRCVYRLAELHEGYSGRLVHDQRLFIGLEGCLVVASAYCLVLGHPGIIAKSRNLDGSPRELPASGPSYELLNVRDDKSASKTPAAVES